MGNRGCVNEMELHGGGRGDSSEGEEEESSARGEAEAAAAALKIARNAAAPSPAAPARLSRTAVAAEDWQGAAERIQALKRELGKASSRCDRRRMQERRLRTSVTSRAEHAASLRVENEALRGRLAAAAAESAATARSLQEVELECGQLRSERQGLCAERDRLLKCIDGLRQEVEGSRLEKRMQSRLQDLALFTLEEQQRARTSPEVGENAALQGRIRDVGAAAMRHQEAFTRAGARCAELRRDVGRLERQVKEVRSSQKLLEQRALELEAQWSSPSAAAGPRAGRRAEGTFDLPA